MTVSTGLSRVFVASVLLFSHLELCAPTDISICSSEGSYSYPIEKCPGGIQIRNVDGWFSKARNTTCVCGQGSLLQFDGAGKPWRNRIYPLGFPKRLQPFQGSWVDYNLNECEGLQGSRSGALFIDARKYDDPSNFPSRSLELIVEANEHTRLIGSYSIKVQSQQIRAYEGQILEALKTIMLNSQKPFLITGANDKDVTVCVHHPTKPQLVLSKYISTVWGGADLAELCEKGTYVPYKRQREECTNTASCSGGLGGASESEDDQGSIGGVESLLKIMEEMAEVSVRMKFGRRHLDFPVLGMMPTTDKPHMAMLLRSCRVFYRGFPDVVRWETLMNALTIFGGIFDGFLPIDMEVTRFDQVRIALGRCSLQQEKRRDRNVFLYKQACVKGNISDWSDNSLGIGGRMDSETNSSDAAAAPADPPAPEEASPVSGGGQPSYNKLIELLWKMVQFTQASCLRGADHYPNVHHMYASAMIDLFGTPAVQVLWYQKPEQALVLEKAMLHIFPELSDNVLPTIVTILKNMHFSDYFNVLKRPQLKHMEKRDMRCGGHGNLIWGGKACCYLEEEDSKFRFYNRVTSAKI